MEVHTYHQLSFLKKMRRHKMLNRRHKLKLFWVKGKWWANYPSKREGICSKGRMEGRKNWVVLHWFQLNLGFSTWSLAWAFICVYWSCPLVIILFPAHHLKKKVCKVPQTWRRSAFSDLKMSTGPWPSNIRVIAADFLKIID